MRPTYQVIWDLLRGMPELLAQDTVTAPNKLFENFSLNVQGEEKRMSVIRESVVRTAIPADRAGDS